MTATRPPLVYRTRTGEVGGRWVDLSVEMPDHGHGMQVEPTMMAHEDAGTMVEGMLFHMEGHWQMRAFVTDADAVTEMAEFHVMCCD